MAELEAIYVKLGGSLITQKTREATPRPDVIARLAREIREALGAMPGLRLVLGHGSGSFGHFAARRYRVHLGARDREGWLGMAETSAAAARLNRLVTDACLEAGLPVISLQPSASARCRDGVLEEMAVEPVESALAHALVPLVYGDVAFDSVRGTAIISTEDIFVHLARAIRPSRMLMTGVVDGIYDDDPLRNPDSRLLPALSSSDVARIRAGLRGSYATDVTGGMLGKVAKLLPLLAECPHVTIHFFSGEIPGHLSQAILDPEAPFGTHLRAG